MVETTRGVGGGVWMFSGCSSRETSFSPEAPEALPVLVASAWVSPWLGMILFGPSLALMIGGSDGNTEPPEMPCPVRCIVEGDATSISVAAASIVAKVTRDRQMVALAERYPGYGWERNMGYGTPEHRLGIDFLGINSQHRRTFRPISELLTTSY